MKKENLTATIEVAKSPEDVFNCLTDVSNWWSKDFSGRSQRLNDEFVIHHPSMHYSKQKLVEVVANKKLVWQVTESSLYWLKRDQEEWTNTRMIFEITTSGDKTALHFTHDGLTHDKECYAMVQQGWNIIVKDWLLHLITFGTPSKDMTMAAEIRDKILKEG